jgi:hypothetical protein
MVAQNLGSAPKALQQGGVTHAKSVKPCAARVLGHCYQITGYRPPTAQCGGGGGGGFGGTKTVPCIILFIGNR